MARMISRMSALVAATAATLVLFAGNASASDSDEYHSAFFVSDDAWINDIGTLLYNDADRNGYFSGISLSFDADTAFNSFEVFIAIDIISHLTPSANHVERLHTTRPFFIYGRSITDEYHVDIDLLTNFPPAIYDLRVTLADAHSREILDEVYARDFHNLRALPLESEDNGTVIVPVVDPVYGAPDNQLPDNQLPDNQAPNDDIRVIESAGSGGPLTVALLISGLLLRLRKH